MKKIFLFSFLFLSACSIKKEIPRDTLFVVLDSRPQTLDPRKAVSANGMRLVDLIFNSFVRLDQKGRLKPDLAISWKLEDLTWVFTLKAHLKFSNGRAVLKEDILFSFEQFKSKSSFQQVFKNIQSVDVIQKPNSQFVVKVTLKKFQAPFISSDLPVLKILPKKESLSKDFSKFPTGTGNFRVIKNDFRQILLKRNTMATEGLAQFISFQVIRDNLTRTQKMLSQEMDVAPSVLSLDKIKKFSDKPDQFKVFSTAGFSTTYLLINLKNEALKKKKLRKALSLAINKEEIIKYKLYGYAIPARSFIHPESFFFNQSLASFQFDLKKAKQIIESLNLKNLKLKLSSSNNSSTLVKARVLASQISQTGLKVSLESNEWGAFYKDIGRGAFDLALMKWVGVRDPDIYRVAFYSENLAPKGRNRSFYKSESLDELLEKGLKERDSNNRKLIYDQIQMQIAQDVIVIPLWHDMEISVVKATIENYQMRANGDFLSLPLIKKK